MPGSLAFRAFLSYDFSRRLAQFHEKPYNFFAKLRRERKTVANIQGE